MSHADVTVTTRLKSEAHRLQPVVQIGKAGLGPQVIAAIESALFTHELIKIQLPENALLVDPENETSRAKDERANISQEIIGQTKSQKISLVGRMLVIYKKRLTPKKNVSNAVASESGKRKTSTKKKAPQKKGAHNRRSR